MPDKEWNISEVNELVDNAHFQARLNKTLKDAVEEAVGRPWRWYVLPVLIFLGLGAGGVGVYFKNLIEEVRTQTTEAASRLQKVADEAEKRVQAVSDKAQAASNDAGVAAKEAEKQVQSVASQATGLRQSAEVTFGAIQAANTAIDATKTNLEASMGQLTSSAKVLNEHSARLVSAQNEASKKLTNLEEQRHILQESIKSTNEALVPIQAKLNMVENIKNTTKSVSDQRTFEFVTLRSHAPVNLVVKHIDNELKEATYDLTFTTHGLSRPFNVDLVVFKLGGEKRTMTYEGLRFRKDDPKRPFYCICGTPLTFQLDNYVQTPFVKDFATLKVLAGQADCTPPTTADPNCQ